MSSFRVLTFACVFAFSGCATAPEAQYYLLPGLPVTERSIFRGETIALRELDLPLYARASQVAHIGESGAVTLSDAHRWADEPQRAATRALAASLRSALDVPVVVEPWGRDIAPELRVDISVDRFIGALGGTLTLSGEFQIVSLTSREVIRTESFSFDEPVTGPGFEALTQAHADALARLAAALVRAIGETSDVGASAAPATTG